MKFVQWQMVITSDPLYCV